MAKTALLSQNDNLMIDSLKQNVGRSVIDLSHSVTTPIDVNGALIPICCIETVPSDSFEINVEVLLQQLTPLKVPLMTSFKLNTAFYYCDNRLGWKKWDRFMTGGRSGNEVYDLPRVCNAWSNKQGETQKNSLFDQLKNTGGSFSNIDYNNSLHTYFGISMNQVATSVPAYDDFVDLSDDCPLAFPFFDYQIIARDIYTDVDRLKQTPDSWDSFYDFSDPLGDWCYENLFPVDDDEFKLNDGVKARCGYANADDPNNPSFYGVCLDKIRYHNVRDDYFTTSKKAPMRGDVPSVDTTVAVSNVDASDVVKLPTREVDIAQIGINVADKELYAGQGKLDSTSTYDTYVTQVESTTNVLRDALEKLKVEIETTKSINAAELRLLSQLTIWQELNMLHKPYYNDFLNAHFNGVSVGESAVERPIYIGGTSQQIYINKVLQTSQTSETSPLGNVGATMDSLQNSYVGKIYCNNYGYIIGIAYIIPDMYYNPAMPRGFSRRTKEDFYSPEFANLSMQATLNKEIFFSNDDNWNNTPWGYTGCFDELRSIPNRVAGDLLNNSYSDLKKWVLRREFSNDNLPAMNSTFLSLHGNVDKSAFQNNSTPAFMMQCANFIKAVRPMPYIAIPKAL